MRFLTTITLFASIVLFSCKDEGNNGEEIILAQTAVKSITGHYSFEGGDWNNELPTSGIVSFTEESETQVSLSLNLTNKRLLSFNFTTKDPVTVSGKPYDVNFTHTETSDVTINGTTFKECEVNVYFNMKDEYHSSLQTRLEPVKNLYRGELKVEIKTDNQNVNTFSANTLVGYNY